MNFHKPADNRLKQIGLPMLTKMELSKSEHGCRTVSRRTPSTKATDQAKFLQLPLVPRR